MANVVATDNVGVSGWRFANAQTSDDGHYQIDNSGHITLTAAAGAGARGINNDYETALTASC